MSSTETPICTSLIICDSVIIEKVTEKKSAIGIFNQINAKRFPVAQSFFVFGSLTNGQGVVGVTLTCRNQETDTELFSVSGELNFPSPNVYHDLVVSLRNPVFKEPGLYTFELTCNDVLIM